MAYTNNQSGGLSVRASRLLAAHDGDRRVVVNWRWHTLIPIHSDLAIPTPPLGCQANAFRSLIIPLIPRISNCAIGFWTKAVGSSQQAAA